MTSRRASADLTAELEIVSYDQMRREDPSNVHLVRDKWDTSLKILFGDAGDFIKTLKYYRLTDPPIPDAMRLTGESIEKTVATKRFDAEVAIVLKRNGELDNQMSSIFALMWSRCSTEAQAQIRRDADFSTLAERDPLGLWKMMLKRLTASTSEAANAKAIAYLGAKNSYNSVKQGPVNSVDTYHDIVFAKLEAVKSLGDPIAEIEKATNFIARLDIERYGALQTALDNELRERPVTLAAAYSMAGKWRLVGPRGHAASYVADRVPSKKKAATPPGKGKKAESPRHGDRRDKKSKGKGKGWSRKAFLKQVEKAKAAGYGKGDCFGCGSSDHKLADCPEVKDAHHTGADSDEDEDEDDEDEEDAHMCMSGVAPRVRDEIMTAFQAASGFPLDKLKSELHAMSIGIDSQCSDHLFGEESLLVNIRACRPTKFRGVGGAIVVDRVGDHPSFGTVYLRPPGSPKINLLSLSVLEKKEGFTIKYHQHAGKFTVKCLDGMMYEFSREGGKLYVCDLSGDDVTVDYSSYHLQSDLEDALAVDPSLCFWDERDGDENPWVALVATVEENERLFTKAQVAAARRVRDFSAAMGFISQANLHHIVRQGRQPEINFGHADINRALEIYGPSLESLRGKTENSKVRREPSKPAGKIVDSELVMHTDIMYVGGLPFLTSVFKPLQLLMSTLVKSKSTGDLKVAIERQKSSVCAEGFHVTEVTSDSEGALVEYAPQLEKAGCRVSIHDKNTDSAEIDVKIKQIKKSIRSILTLPYVLPFMLLAYAVYFAVSKINLLPSRANAHGESPMEMFLGRPISIARDLGGVKGVPTPFGARCEIYEGTDNTMADRTSFALFLGSKGDSYHTHRFFKGATRTVVTRSRFTPLPMDAGTIQAVNHIARSGSRVLPGKVPIFFHNKEVGDDGEEDDQVPELEIREPSRLVVDSGHAPPDLAEMSGTYEDNRREIVRADEFVPPASDHGQLQPEDQTDASDLPTREEDSPTVPEGSGGAPPRVEERGAPPRAEGGVARAQDGPRFWEYVARDHEAGRDRYHHPARDAEKSGAPKAVVEPPDFLSGEPVQPSEGRSKRERRPVDRLTYAASQCYDEAATAEAYVALSQEEPHQVTHVPVRPGPLRNRVQQSRVERSRERHHSAYVLSVDRALRQFGEKATESLMTELRGLDAKEVFKQVKLSGLSRKERRRIIRSKMFLKEKFLSSGDFDKLKARYVAGGHMQRKEEYDSDETSSPTVGLSSVYLVASIAAREGRHVASMDVGTAYLNADMKHKVVMRVEKKLAELLVQINPTKYQLDQDGHIYVLLEKALYGCLESSKLWYDEICGTLKAAGFRPNPQDPCVFNMQRNGHQVTVCLYVDDILCTSIAEEDIAWLVALLRGKYKTVTLNDGKVHSYLGQTFDFTEPGQVSVSMEGYVRDVLDSYEVTGYRATPAATHLYDIAADLELLEERGQREFHSRVMKLMFLAQRARPDILTAVAFLSSRCSKATEDDSKKLARVLMYLNSTADLKMTLCAEDEMRVHAYVDASFAVHHDMRSHTGGVISLGRGAVHVSSKKQRLMTKSSTEAELVGISDVLPQILWTREFLISQGHVVGPAVLYQDNMSTIALANKGRSTSARTRHVAIRYFFVKDRIDAREIEIEYMPTGDMRADVLTKPLQGDLFRQMRAELMGISGRAAGSKTKDAPETRGAKKI
jgi:hypothetical protein